MRRRVVFHFSRDVTALIYSLFHTPPAQLFAAVYFPIDFLFVFSHKMALPSPRTIGIRVVDVTANIIQVYIARIARCSPASSGSVYSALDTMRWFVILGLQAGSSEEAGTDRSIPRRYGQSVEGKIDISERYTRRPPPRGVRNSASCRHFASIISSPRGKESPRECRRFMKDERIHASEVPARRHASGAASMSRRR